LRGSRPRFMHNTQSFPFSRTLIINPTAEAVLLYRVKPQEGQRHLRPSIYAISDEAQCGQKPNRFTVLIVLV